MVAPVGGLEWWHQVSLSEVPSDLLRNQPLNDLRGEGQVGNGSIVLEIIRVSIRFLQDWCDDSDLL